MDEFHDAFVCYGRHNHALGSRVERILMELEQERERTHAILVELIRMGLRIPYFQYFHPQMSVKVRRKYLAIWHEVHGEQSQSAQGPIKQGVAGSVTTRAQVCALGLGYSLHLMQTHRIPVPQLRPNDRPEVRNPYALYHAYRSLARCYNGTPPIGPDTLLLGVIEAASTLAHPGPKSSVFVTRCRDSHCKGGQMLLLVDYRRRQACPICGDSLRVPDYWSKNLMGGRNVTVLDDWKAGRRSRQRRQTSKPIPRSGKQR